jgi:hypothetical protein
MKTLKEMEEAVNTLTAYTCAGLIIVLILLIIIYGLQILIGLLVTLSIGG